MQTYNVDVSHDLTNALWIVDGSDIPGLNVEATSYEQRIDIVRDAAPDLLEPSPGQNDRAAKVIPLAFQHRIEAPRLRSA